MFGIRRLWIVALILILLVQPIAAQTPYATWEAPEGIDLISYSAAWKEEALEQLYLELKNNIHGEEIYYLNSITIEAAANAEANGRYIYNSNKQLVVTTSFAPFLPADFPVLVPSGEIVLYSGDTKARIDQLARTLAHEYGHHFTYYHFLTCQSPWEYARIRQIADHPRVGLWLEDPEHYMDNWMWEIREIAAEDYVQLLGSPTVKGIVEAKDIDGMLKYYLDNPALSYSRIWQQNMHPPRAGNTYPHANFFLPLPAEVPGLKEYFMHFVDPEFTYTPPDIPRPTLAYTRRSLEGADQYTFTWQPVTDDSGVVYTLMSYNEERNTLVAVKTVRGNDDLQAVVGIASRHGYTWNDGLIRENQHFRLYVTLPCGHMVSSDPVTILPRKQEENPWPGHRPQDGEDEAPPPKVQIQVVEQPGQLTFTLNLEQDFGLDYYETQHPLAIALTNSPEPPDLWQWQEANRTTNTLSASQPGTWYVHFFASVDRNQPLLETFGPYEIPASSTWARLVSWWQKLITS